MPQPTGSPQLAAEVRRSGAGELDWASAALFAVAAVTIAIGTVSANLDGATLLVTLALVVTAIGLFAPRMRWTRRVHPDRVVDILSFGIVLEVLMSVLDPPLREPAYRFALVGLGIGAIWVIRYGRHFQRIGLVVLVAAHFVLMAVALASTEPPLIDVIQFQQEGPQALLDGANPYELRFRNIYGPGDSYYAPEVIDGDRVTFGFPYPPLSLLMATPGYMITGDFRLGAAAAVSVTVLLVASTRLGKASIGAGLLIMLAPPVWRVLYNGWSEAFAVPFLALTVYLAVRGGWRVPIALGLLIAMKQYLVPLVLIGAVLIRRTRATIGWTRMILVPVGIAAATVVPFLLWDVASFIYSTVTFHGLQPFRTDATSLTAMAARAGLPEAPSWVGFAVAGGATALALWKGPRTPTGFAAASAFVLLAFFLFGKQAFVNYYLIALVALASSVAAVPLQPASTSRGKLLPGWTRARAALRRGASASEQ